MTGAFLTLDLSEHTHTHTLRQSAIGDCRWIVLESEWLSGADEQKTETAADKLSAAEKDAEPEVSGGRGLTHSIL